MTRYFYYPIYVELTDEEKSDYYEVSKKISKAMMLAGNDLDDDDNIPLKALLSQRGRILASASNKLIKLKEMAPQFKDKANLIIYCGDKIESNVKYIDKVYEIVNNEEGIISAKFTAEENPQQRRDILDLFGKKVIQRKDIMRHISKNFKYFLLSDRFQEISDFLEEKRKKKELPSDIKVQFVHDLLESGECICGQKLIKGEVFHSNITKLLETAGREELDNAYITMRAFVDSNEINETTKGFYDRINAYASKLLGFSGRIEEIDKSIKEIGKKLANDFGDLIASHGNYEGNDDEYTEFGR